MYYIIYQYPSDNQFQRDDIEIYMLYLGRRTVNTCRRHFAGKKCCRCVVALSSMVRHPTPFAFIAKKKKRRIRS